MTDIITFILIVAFGYLAIRLITFSYKRFFLLFKLKELKKERGAKITLHNFLLRPAWYQSKRPDITVELSDTVYHIRLYSGIASHKVVHFANERFSVVYSELKSIMIGRRGGYGRSVAVNLESTHGAKVFVMPPMEIKEDNRYRGKRAVRVLLFNPAPRDVYFVTEKKNKIKPAFTGDMLYGWQIFTASSFVAYADRRAREYDSGIRSAEYTQEYEFS